MSALPSVQPRPRSLRRVLVGLAPVSLAVQVSSFVSSIALARVLGADSSTDAYYLGLSIPVAAYSILLIAIRLGGIPALAERHASDPASFDRAAGDVVFGTLLASIALTIAVTAAALVVVPLAVGAETGESSRLVMLELAPLGVLGAMTGALGAVLAVRGVFAPAVAVMTIEPLVKIALIIAVGDRIGINALVLGNLAGSTCAVAVLWAIVRRRGIRLRFRRDLNTTFVRGIFAISIPLLVSQSVLQTNPIVDRVMAGSLDPGSVTALEIGLRICLVPLALVTGLMITPLTTTWAERRLRGGWPELRRSLARAIVAIAMFAPPTVVLGVVLRRELVGIAYEGGAYSPEALADTTLVFALTLLALPAQLLTVVLSTLFVIERAMIVPMLIGIANVVLNVGLNFALRPSLDVAGIALSTTLTIVALTVAYAVVAQRRWRALALRPEVPRLVLAAVSAVAVAALAVALRDALPTAATRPEALFVIVSVAGAGFALHAAILLSREPAARLHRAIAGPSS